MHEQRKILENFKGIIDSTLREGFQFSRANFSLKAQKKIFSYLSRIRVDYIELGNPVKPEIREMIAAVLGRKGARRPRVLCHIRNRGADVEAALACGVEGVNILCLADPERLAAIGLTRREYLSDLERNVGMAKANGLEVRVGVEDFFGQPEELSREIHQRADGLGVDRIAVADTLGRTMSWEVGERIGDLRSRIAADIEVHFHNDLGHSVGNSLAALQAGANWVSTTLLGIGERTGITPLSSLLINLHLLAAEAMGRYDLSLLTKAETYISRICGIDMPPHLMTNPVNGFAHKAGIHLNAMMKFGPQKYEPVSPSVVGNRRSLVINTLLSGRTSPAEVEEFNKRYSC